MNENLPLPWSLVVYETTARVYGEFESRLGVLKIENNYYPFTETDYRAPHVMLEGRQGGSFPIAIATLAELARERGMLRVDRYQRLYSTDQQQAIVWLQQWIRVRTEPPPWIVASHQQ